MRPPPGAFLAAALLLPLIGQESSVKFTTASNLVVVDLTVRDKSGKPIEDLRAADFTVMEDGQPQRISIFEFQRLSVEKPPEQPTAPVIEERKNQIATDTAGRIRYDDRRLIVMFFDFSGMKPPEQLRAQQAALQFLDNRMTASDLVAILTFAGGLRVEQDFTDDRAALRRIVESFRLNETAEDETPEDPEAEVNPEEEPAFAADEAEFNIFNTDRKLAALESAARLLAPLPQKKALVYFSSGAGKTGAENQSQLRATINSAVRANVAFYPIDARGLVAMPPGADAASGMPRGAAIFSGQTQRRQRDKFNDAQETLTALASGTGGKAFLDSNNLALGVVQAQRDVRSYYILGYYSTNAAMDGRYRRIEVKVNPKLEARLDYRRGYFGAKEWTGFNSAGKERQLQEALAMAAPVTGLSMALEVNWFQTAPDRYFVPVAVKIPGSQIPLDRNSAEFDFIGQVRGATGRVAAVVRDGIRIKLDPERAGQFGQRNLQYDTGFSLPPGSYRIKFLVRENGAGRMGTFETKFTIPDLNAQETLKVSSVVWAHQREPLNAALAAAERKKKLLALNPLVDGAHKLVPSITRAFRRSQTLFVYAEVYEPRAGVAATLSFLTESGKAFESAPLRFTKPLKARPQAVPVRFQVPLKGLRPGDYVAQLNLIDEAGRKFAFPRAKLVLVR